LWARKKKAARTPAIVTAVELASKPNYATFAGRKGSLDGRSENLGTTKEIESLMRASEDREHEESHGGIGTIDDSDEHFSPLVKSGSESSVEKSHTVTIHEEGEARAVLVDD